MMEQQTQEWFDARLGKVTASRIKDVVAKTKSGYSTSRKNYAAQLVVERMTGQKAESYTNAAMQWGVDQEPNARAEYEMTAGGIVEEVGFIDHPRIQMSGASPDGLVGDEGLWEGKCPITATHLDYLISKEPPQEYYIQVQWQMACTGRKWCDLMSYDPRMPKKLQSKVWRICRDDKFISELELEVESFLKEVEEKISMLKEMMNEKS